MLNVVIDTNILVSALWSADGTSSKIAHLIPEKVLVPHISKEILLEYQTVLTRPKFNFTAAQVDDLICGLVKYGKNCSVPNSDIFLPDESDRIFYDVAKVYKTILITGNKKHYPSEPFVLNPREFMDFLEAIRTRGF